jgi:hypothetical protein
VANNKGLTATLRLQIIATGAYYLLRGIGRCFARGFDPTNAPPTEWPPQPITSTPLQFWWPLVGWSKLRTSAMDIVDKECDTRGWDGTGLGFAI